MEGELKPVDVEPQPQPQPQDAQRASLLKVGATKSDNLAGNQAIWESSNLTIQESSNLAMRVQ